MGSRLLLPLIIQGRNRFKDLFDNDEDDDDYKPRKSKKRKKEESDSDSMNEWTTGKYFMLFIVHIL